MFQAPQTARERREYLQGGKSRKCHWAVVCKRGVLKMNLKRILQAALSVDFILGKVAIYGKNLEGRADIIRLAHQKDPLDCTSKDRLETVVGKWGNGRTGE